MVILTICILLTVPSEILLCSRWGNVPTLTYEGQLPSILSISCNIQHLVQQQSQWKLNWSGLRKRTFHHFRRANMANQQSGLPNDVNKRMNTGVSWKQNESDRLGNCAACDSKRILRPRNNEKRTSPPMKRKRNWLRIMLRERQLGSGTNGSKFSVRVGVRFQPGTELLQLVSTQHPLLTI
jgi:hypothetical protein